MASRLPANGKQDPLESPSLTRQPSFLRPKGVRQPPHRGERQSAILEGFQIPTPPPSPGIPRTIHEGMLSWDAQGSPESPQPSISRRSSISTSATTARSLSPSSRSPSPFAPQFSSIHQPDSLLMINLASPRDIGSAVLQQDDSHEIPCAPREDPMSPTRFRSNGQYPNRYKGRPSGSISPVKGPRPRFRPLSTISLISNVVAIGEFTPTQ